MKFLVLGPLTVLDGEAEIAVGRARERVLLSILIINAGVPVSDDSLIEELWGSDPPGNPTAALQTATSRLRKALQSTGSGPLIIRSGKAYRLEVEPTQIDAGRFSELVAQARATDDLAHRTQLLDAALALWRGPAHASVRFESFAQPEIRRLQELRAEARELRIDAEMTRGNHRQVIGELESLVASFPLREGLWSSLMLALYRSGRQSEALRVFQRARVAIAEASGLEPSAELARLEEAILMRDPSIDIPAGWDDVVGAEDPLSNLPPQLSSFVGRERDMDSIAELIAVNRFVSLVGPGGVGKSRLAEEFASRNRQNYPDGVVLIPLGNVSHDDQLVDAVLTEFSSTITPVATQDDLISLLRRRVALLILDNCEHVAEASAVFATALLGEAPSVSVLTTTRHRLGLPGEQVWQVGALPIPELHGGSPGTSYAAVNLFIDRARAVRPDLRLDDHDTLHAAEQIVRSLDGLPLAIELAASQCFALSPEVIAGQLAEHITLPPSRDPLADPKHRTLEAAVDWSLQHLPEHERSAFFALSVVPTSFGLEETRSVCAELLPPGGTALSLLGDLAENSLIERTDDEARFRMLRPLRAVAQNRLEAAGQYEPTQRRYTSWLADLTAGWVDALNGPESPQIVERFNLELWNILGAAEWALRNEPKLALRLLAGPRFLWLAHGMGWTAIRSLHSALSLSPERDGDRIHALNTLAFLVSVSEHGTAISRQTVRFDLPAVAYESGTHRPTDLRGIDPLELAQEAIDISLELKDDASLAYSRYMQGYAFAPRSEYEAAAAEVLITNSLDPIVNSHRPWERGSLENELSRIKLLQGDFDAAREYAMSSLHVRRRLGDTPGQIISLDLLARIARAQSEIAEAIERYTEALPLAESAALPPAIAARLRIELGYLMMHSDDPDPPAAEFAKALAAARRYGLQQTIAGVRLAQAHLALVDDNRAIATAYLDEALGIAQASGDKVAVAYVLGAEGVAMCLEEDLAAAADLFRQSMLVQGSEFDWVAVARALEGLGYIAAHQDRYRDAATLIGAAETQRNVARTPRERFADLLEQSPLPLPPDELEAALDEGRGLDVAAAVTFALSQ